MSKETKKEPNIVEEYLVERIRELEKENKLLSSKLNEETIKRIDAENKVESFDKLKSLFKFETACICLYNLDGKFETVLATSFTDFGKELVNLLGLKEKE